MDVAVVIEYTIIKLIISKLDRTNLIFFFCMSGIHVYMRNVFILDFHLV